MKRLTCIILLVMIVTVIASPSVVAQGNPISPVSSGNTQQEAKILYTGSKSEIDATKKDEGYLGIRYLNQTSKRLKIRIIKLKSDGSEDLSYIYDLNSKGTREMFSLSQGSGRYTVKILENIEGDRYAVVQTQTIDIKLTNEFAPFLVPIQYINYTSTSKAVAKAKELTKNCKTDLEKVQAVYKYILDNVIYDYDKAKKVVAGQLNGYIPTVDVILDSKKGICFDYSSLMGAMLRSIGVPTKLVMGYVAPNNGYHAWNDVYISGKGWIKINSQVYFDGKNFSRMDSTFAAANKSGKQTEFIGNGKNYSPLYQY